MIAHQLPITALKRCSSSSLLLFFAAVQRDALDVLAHANQRVAEVRFDPLLTEIQRRQRAADEMGEPTAEYRIHHGDPDHVTWHVDSEYRHGARQGPQNGQKAEQRDDVGQQIQAEHERAAREVAQVLGDALVRIVGADCGAVRVRGQADVVVSAIGQPLVEKLRGHPVTPADLKPLVQVDRIDRDGDPHGSQFAESRHQAARRAAIQDSSCTNASQSFSCSAL